MIDKETPSTHEPENQAHAFLIFFAIVMLIVVPAAITLHSVEHPGALVILEANPTPRGYTVSLLLFVLPLACLAWWFLRHPRLRFSRKSFWWTIGILVPGGFVLDLLFGNAFFLFENREAILGVFVPALGGPIPLEEFVFYVSGFMLILLTYIWCDEYWLVKYNVPDYVEAAKGIRRIVQFHAGSLALGTVLLAAAFVYKKIFAATADGFPSYFTYLVLASITPSVGFFDTAKPFINWRAFGFTFFPIVLISLLWEVTLAVPYQWWGYKTESMIGIYIGAWSNLPIEAVCVWLAVTFTTVIVYEVMKIWHAMGKKAGEAFLGSRPLH
ncbi:MAG: hypothetical protein HY961_02090 [Ignavibacteriae bacterium]|nr:hypothetical protein [Ignavibacteriota bacterium]